MFNNRGRLNKFHMHPHAAIASHECKEFLMTGRRAHSVEGQVKKPGYNIQ